MAEIFALTVIAHAHKVNEDNNGQYMELRILRKKAQPFDSGFPVYSETLQVRFYLTDQRKGETKITEWADVPIVEE